MCKTCDTAKEWALDLVLDLRKTQVSMYTFRALESSRVICEDYNALVTRACELATDCNDLQIKQAARKVLVNLKVSDLEKTLSGKDSRFLRMETLKLPDFFSELEVDDPFGNKRRFLEINDALWSKYFEHEKESGLRPEIVGWIQSFASKRCRPVIDQLIRCLDFQSEEIREGALKALESIKISELSKMVESALSQDGLSQNKGTKEIFLPLLIV